MALLGHHHRLHHGRHHHGGFCNALARHWLYRGFGLAARLCAGLAVAVYWRLGSISVRSVHEPRVEVYYWITITFSQTLGTALGDWAAGTHGLGYSGAALAFAMLLAVVAALHFTTRISKALLFWGAFILTRPLGAAVGDFLDKPLDHGGLAFSRPLASLALAAVIAVLIFILPQRASQPEAEVD
jgi:uncharacterized membrane-anchored protein